MIGGKLQNGDVILDVEQLKTQNVCPYIYKGTTSLGASTGVMDTDPNNHYYWVPGAENKSRRIYPNWTRSASPDAYGNYKYTLSGQAHSRLVHEALANVTYTGNAGKYYSAKMSMALYVICMPGHQDYIPQPPLRVNLYASNGNKSQDVLIAKSKPIQGNQSQNFFWPFHPGRRNLMVDVEPVAPMPTGKTRFRLSVEHDTTWTANKEIWLPWDYYGGKGMFPPQLAFCDINYRECVIFEESVTQDWYGAASTTNRYDWKNETATNSGYYLQTGFEVDKDSDLKTYGAVFACKNAKANAKIRVQGNGQLFTSTPLAIGWNEIVIPAIVFQSTTDPIVTIQLGQPSENTANISIEQPRLYANIGWTDTDGHNYYRFANRVSSVSQIDISRHDAQVSTCNITLRDDTGIDTSDVFAPGKRIRVRTNTMQGIGNDEFMGSPINHSNVVYTGTIDIRRTTYPHGARPEIKVLCANNYPTLLEKTNVVLSDLESYAQVFPALGVPTVTDQGYFTPKSVDVTAATTGEQDYAGLTALRDDKANMSLLDAVTITRNSLFAYVWFDRWDRLHLHSDVPVRTNVFTDKAPGLGEFSFSSTDLNFGTDNIINYIACTAYEQVYALKDDGTSEASIAKIEFNVSDAASIRKNRKAEYKLEMLTQYNYEDIEAKILDQYKDPKITISKLSFPVRDMNELELATQFEIYENIEVSYEEKLDNARYRINTVSHYITPGETWVTELGFGLSHDSVLW